MSLFEFTAALEGFAEFHGSKTKSPAEISDADLAAMGIEGFEDG